MKKLIVVVLLSCLLITLSCNPSDQINNQELENGEEGEPYKYTQSPVYQVLFIGASYFSFNNLIPMIRQMAKEAKKEILIDERVINGTYLMNHAYDPTTTAKINEKKWDFVVLQGVGSNMAYPETEGPELLTPLKKIFNTIKDNHQETKVIYCMPWAFEDGMLWKQGYSDDYTAMQEKIYTNTLDYSKIVDFLIAPVGWAWYQILTQNQPPHYLHMSDYNHPSPKGSYLMACVIFSTIYLESIENLPYTAGLDSGMTKTFRKIASDVVLNDLELWKLK